MSLGKERQTRHRVKSTYLRCATEGGSCAVVFNVLLAEPKVSKDNVSL